MTVDELDKDLRDLLVAARNAIDVLRHAAEQLEVEGRDSSAERGAVRQLGMAVQLVEYDLFKSDEAAVPWDWRML